MSVGRYPIENARPLGEIGFGTAPDGFDFAV
jgi:hypothetical protein